MVLLLCNLLLDKLSQLVCIFSGHGAKKLDLYSGMRLMTLSLSMLAPIMEMPCLLPKFLLQFVLTAKTIALSRKLIVMIPVNTALKHPQKPKILKKKK